MSLMMTSTDTDSFSNSIPANCTHPSTGGHESDEFRMFSFKVKRCSKTRNHDWTECPYAHRGEKARRRDPRKHPYVGVACAEFRHAGECSKGQRCEFAHGVFEFWLHPMRYRTRACKAGPGCQRRVCFFAHTPEQLRVGRTDVDCGGERWCSEWACGCWASASAGVSGGVGEMGGMEDVVEGMMRLKVSAEGVGGGGGEIGESPDIGWICELVK